MSKQLLSTAEAAKYLNVSESFLKQSRMKDRKTSWTPGPSYMKVGRNLVRYRVEDLEEWLRRHRVELAS